MNLILIIVFVLAFILFNWLLEVLNARNSLPIDMIRIYDRMKGEDNNTKKSRIKRLNIFKKIDKQIYLKRIIPSWLGLYLACWFLLKNLLVALPLSFILYFALHMYQKLMKQIKRKELFTYQFREALISMSNSLKAGVSLPSAIERCKNELTNTLRTQAEKPILKELEIMVNEIRMGKSLAEVLSSFQQRMQMEEVDNFVNAAIITEKTGGNLSEVMVNVCTMIGDRIQMKREIESLTAGKRSESRILTIAPLLIIPALALLSPSYLKPMYDTFLGKMLMSIAFMLLIANFIIGKKIMNIKL